MCISCNYINFFHYLSKKYYFSLKKDLYYYYRQGETNNPARKVMNYQERCKIVSVAKSKSSNNYYVVCQSSKCIEDTNNPFHGQKKMHVIKADKVYMQTLLGMWKFERLGKLVGKQVIIRLEHNPYSCFDKVTGVCKDQTFAFRAIPQTIPKFVLEDAEVIVKGEMI